MGAPLLARLCLALAYAEEAAAQVQAVGLLVKAPHTKLPIQSPWVAIMNRQTEIARKLAPSSRRPGAAAARGGCPARRVGFWRRRRRRSPSVETKQ